MRPQICARRVGAVSAARCADQMAPLQGYQKRLDDAISRMGRQPHTSVPIERTAYATMWFGPSMSAAFWSLRIMLHTLRQHDRVREVVVLTPQSSASELRHGRFAQLEREAAPLSYLQVHPLNAAESASSTCQATRNLTASARLHVAHASTSAYATMWSKFHIWNLTRFERVLYIDADVMILHPLDRLWSTSLNEKQLFAAAHTLSPSAASYLDANATGGWTGEPSCKKQFPKASWNAGVLLLRPSAAVMEEIMRTMGGRHLSYRCGNGDQPFFNFILRHYGVCFRSTFNCYHPAVVTAPTALEAMTVVGRTRCYPADSSKFSLEEPSTWEPRVLHFAVPNKPWSASGHAATATHYGRMWLAAKRNLSRRSWQSVHTVAQ